MKQSIDIKLEVLNACNDILGAANITKLITSGAKVLEAEKAADPAALAERAKSEYRDQESGGASASAGA